MRAVVQPEAERELSVFVFLEAEITVSAAPSGGKVENSLEPHLLLLEKSLAVVSCGIQAGWAE